MKLILFVCLHDNFSSLIWKVVSAKFAAYGLCVTTTILTPSFTFKSLNTYIMDLAFGVSSSPVGSSARIMDGLFTRAQQ